MKILLRNVRSGKRQALIKDLNKVTEKELGDALDDVKKALIKSLELVVADWSHEVKFDARKYIRPDSLSINVFPTGENKDLWNLISRTGAKPHPIDAKNKPRLIFKGPKGVYVPKTKAKPARTVMGGGKAVGGETVYAKHVEHPGFEPRRFEEQIAEDIKPDFQKVTENAFRRISRALEE